MVTSFLLQLIQKFSSHWHMCGGENQHIIRIHRCGWDVHFFTNDRNFLINSEATSPSPDRATNFQAEISKFLR